MKFKNIFLAICIFSTLATFAQPKKKQQAPEQKNAVVLLSPEKFQQKLKTEKGIIIDVRTLTEYKKGHLKEAHLMDIFNDSFETEINRLDKNLTYYVYCQSGGRSAEAAEKMHKKGFKLVYDLDGGFAKWKSLGLPVEFERW